MEQGFRGGEVGAVVVSLEFSIREAIVRSGV